MTDAERALAQLIDDIEARKKPHPFFIDGRANYALGAWSAFWVGASATLLVMDVAQRNPDFWNAIVLCVAVASNLILCQWNLKKARHLRQTWRHV